MTILFGRLMLILVLLLPSTILFVGNGPRSSNLAFADNDDGGANDPIEGEDDEATVEDESATGGADDSVDLDDTEGVVTQTEQDEEEEEKPVRASDDVDTTILFTKPIGTTDLPAGRPVRFLVGFTNKGELDFTVSSVEASFRYPQDYSFYIQNFTTLQVSQVVEPNKQATFDHGFAPGESLTGRPFGLTISVNYKDSEGKVFQNAVFNETINIIEPDEGLDGETFFLYVFLAAVGVLLLVGVQQLYATYLKKRLSKPRQIVETGTQNSDVDYSWLPKETLQGLNRSPRRSPKQSPRSRRTKRSTGAGED